MVEQLSSPPTLDASLSGGKGASIAIPPDLEEENPLLSELVKEG